MEEFKEIAAEIKEAEENGLMGEETDVLTGYSGKKLVGLLQRLSRKRVSDEACYLEVGVYQGLTLLSVAKELSKGKAYGIDNFAFFDRDGKNFSLVKERKQKLNIDRAEVINMDYEDALENLSEHINHKKVGVYFIDGPHDYRSQLMCLLLILPHLADNAIILVDDCNYRHVRQANRDFLSSHPEYKLIYQSYGKSHPLNMNAADRKEAENGWWDGINVIVKDPDNKLPQMLPPTFRSRLLYENEHAIHATKHPDVVPGLLPIVNLLAPLYKLIFKKRAVIKGKYKEMNTYSDGLPKNDFNQALK